MPQAGYVSLSLDRQKIASRGLFLSLEKKNLYSFLIFPNNLVPSIVFMVSMDLETVFQQLRNGDRSNFATFYESTKKSVFYNILALTKNYDTSEDLLQETFIRFLQKIDEIKDVGKAIGYLFTISRNVTLDWLKKESRSSELEFEDLSPSYDSYSHIEESLLLVKIRGVLKDKEFQIFTLHVLDDMTFEEIHHLLKRPLGTVLWIYNNAIKKLRKEISYEDA